MRFNKITLFKSYMDNDYNNVFDFKYLPIHNNLTYVNAKDLLYNKVIKDLFYYEDIIDDNQFKGVNMSNDKSLVVTIKQEQLTQDIKGFNYIVLTNTDNNDIYFGFIRSYNSIGNTVYNLNIQYDVWNNNIDKILELHTDNNSYGVTNTKHFKSLQNKSSNIYTPIKYYNNDINEVENCIYSKTVLNKHNVIGENGKYGNVLFLKITTSEPIKDADDTEIRPSFGSLPIYYVPVGLLLSTNYTIDNKYTPFLVKGLTGYQYLYRTLNGNPNIYEIFKYEPFKKISPYIVNVELTFNTPLQYKIEKLTDASAEYGVDFERSLTNAFSDTSQFYYNPLIFITPTTGTLASKELNTRDNIKETYSFNLDTYTPYDIYNNDKTFDVMFTMFPYTYRKLYIGDNSKILAEHNPTYTKCEIECIYDTDVMGVKVKYIDAINNSYFEEPVTYDRYELRRFIPFSKDSTQFFLNTQGSQALFARNSVIERNGINALGSSIKNLISVYTGNYQNVGGGAIVNSFMNIGMSFRNYKAILTDVENTPDTVVKTLYKGDIDFYYLDLPIIVTYTYKDSNYDIKNYKEKIYLYGYDYNMKESLFSITKFFFDYCSYSNPIINTFNIDNYDKEVLKQLFTRGFTRNYVHFDNNLNIITSYNDKSLVNSDYEIGEMYYNYIS